ncbi:MAG: 3-deoxy-manno-octulosonate cytidylyltransferase [Elusimicrobia bacterium]|nr:3-deoxy-manno-octulosonate cytidylyltransferase [Elusimicrobiota bacterium]
MSGTLVVIPARLASTRLPRKVLLPLAGLPVVEWCRRAAVRAGVGPVVVATDHPEVAEAVERLGGDAVMTAPECPSGTDRAAQAARKVERARGKRFTAIVNLQGDEPFIRPSTIKAVAALVSGHRPACDISTAVVPLDDPRRAAEPNLVKAVLAHDGRCLYFTRAPSPYPARGAAPRYHQHIGIYGFVRAALDRFVRLPPSPLEKLESLEQLRALEAGMTISAAVVKDRTVAIDTAADLARAARLRSRHV